MISLAKFALCANLIYALLLAVGGSIGYAKKKSVVSLVAGITSALFIFFTIFFAWDADNKTSAFLLLSLLNLTLMVMFFNRYLAAGRKLVPSGIMTLVSGTSFLVTFVALIFG